jgi:hypothetical protein
MDRESGWDGATSRSTEDEWLWGWDPTPGIVSVWAERDGRAIVWRRIVETGALVREEERFRPWLLLDRLDDLRHLGLRLEQEAELPVEARSAKTGARISYRELDGPGMLRYSCLRTMAGRRRWRHLTQGGRGGSANMLETCESWARRPYSSCRRKSSTS